MCSLCGHPHCGLEATVARAEIDEMNASVKAQWITELRSGAYSQTFGTLRDSVGFCATGVLCDIYAYTHGIPEDVAWSTETFRNHGLPTYDPAAYKFYLSSSDGEVPSEVMEWAGMSDLLVDIITDMNDKADIPLQEIAAYLAGEGPIWQEGENDGTTATAELQDVAGHTAQPNSVRADHPDAA